MLPMLALLRVGPRDSAPALTRAFAPLHPRTSPVRQGSSFLSWHHALILGVIVMRPRGYYAVFAEGYVRQIVEGAAEARSLTPDRAYKRFTTRIAAEEFAAWHNRQRDDQRAAEHAAIRERIAAKAASDAPTRRPALSQAGPRQLASSSAHTPKRSPQQPTQVGQQWTPRAQT